MNYEKTLNRLEEISEKMEDEIGKFAIPYCKHEDGIIVGNLSQTYNIDLIKLYEKDKEDLNIRLLYNEVKRISDKLSKIISLLDNSD